MMNIKAVAPAAPYIGGKSNLAKTLCQIIENTDHKIYAEPFVGQGGVFLRRERIPKCEVINDVSGDLVNFFRILQRHYPQFMDCLKFQITSRKEFERLKASNPATLTDLERAARYIYLQKTAFGGKVSGQNFGIDYEHGGRFNLLKLAPMLEDIHERLAGVLIENLDWLDFINRYDRDGTLFYCDPPYFGCEDDYGKNIFDREQFAIMATRLKTIKGKFIVSINNVPEIKQCFKDFNIKEVDVRYTLSIKNDHMAKELIISNYEPEKTLFEDIFST